MGKSRLVAEFLARADVPSVFFAASGQSTAAELTLFVEAARGGGVAGFEAIRADAAGSWETALLLATADATSDRPVVVVIDELPYLAASEPAMEGILQEVWRTLERRAVLLVLIGSDISMMASLTEYRRPLYGRAREMVVHPLSVADVAAIHGLSPGGPGRIPGDRWLPGLALRWQERDTVGAFLARELAVETGPLAVTGERMMSAELPADAAARAVLLAIGAGERSHGAISARAGITRGTFERTLALLTRKGVIDRVVPYAEAAVVVTSLPRERPVPALLAALHPAGAGVHRPRTTRSGAGARHRGLERLPGTGHRAPGARIHRADAARPRDSGAPPSWVPTGPGTAAWRLICLVGGQEPAHAVEVAFIGSVKWRDREPFGRDDLAALRAAAAAVPGAGMVPRLVGVSRTGFAVDGLDVALGPDELVATSGGPSR